MRCLRLAVLGFLTVGALAPELCAQPTFSVTDVTIVEGNSGTARAVFTVSLAPATTDTVRAGYNAFAGTSTKPGTATPGVDFGTVSGTVVFPPGTTSRPVDVPVFGDWIAEADETFSLNIWSGPWRGSGEIVARGTGTITNDDPAGLSINDVIVRERVGTTATATFTITLAPASGTPVTVNYATADGTATAGSDYLTGSGLLTFAPGETTKPMSVTVNPDALVEGVETFVVNLSGAAGAGIAHGTATGRILDPPGGGDFNADGNNDLVWRHDASGENAIWHMDGTTLLGGTFTDPQALADMAWRIAGTNDFNADGRPDLLWRHSVSGENVLWYMNGAVLQSGTFLTPASTGSP